MNRPHMLRKAIAPVPGSFIPPVKISRSLTVWGGVLIGLGRILADPNDLQNWSEAAGAVLTAVGLRRAIAEAPR